MHEAFTKHNRLEGVIHVVDWGYTLVRDEIVANKMIEEDKIDTIEKLRELNLNNELREFENICSRIKEAHSLGKGPKWLVIAVNKADLYIEEIAQAQKYYHVEMESDFTDNLNQLKKQIGENNIHAISVPVCSWETDFEWNDQIVKTNIGGTDKRRALFRHFIQQISRIAS